MKMKNVRDGNKSDPLTIQPYSRLVSLPVGPENVFYFPQGLPAFEEFKQYLFAFNPEYHPFVFMNSIEAAGLSFVCIDPFLIYPEYAPRLSQADQKLIGATSPDDVQLLSIVTVRSDMNETTANLQGPIAINIKNSLCKQILCEGQSYPIRCRVLDALEQSRPTMKQKEAVC
jgi:flagellar assembly factor FliW